MRAKPSRAFSGSSRKPPANDFQANEAFFQIVLLAYNLLNSFKRLCVPPHLQRAALQRPRQRLFVVPAQLVRPGRVPTLRLGPSYPWAVDFLVDAEARSATAAAVLGPLREVHLAREREFVEIHKSSFFTQDSG
jgi:hypothetical protein